MKAPGAHPAIDNDHWHTPLGCRFQQVGPELKFTEYKQIGIDLSQNPSDSPAEVERTGKGAVWAESPLGDGEPGRGGTGNDAFHC